MVDKVIVIYLFKYLFNSRFYYNQLNKNNFTRLALKL